ncbi:MAG: hypothetical protein LC620_01765 [Halobacteriales archaeon]|nr:hypothetical protein [Halobacteriales archaeon]
MDPATVVRDDLRSYALRRCIRFYSAIVVAAIYWGAGAISLRSDEFEASAIPFGVIFSLLVLVELASGIVMLEMARVRNAYPGPETPLWKFAQGPHPSWIAALFFAGLAALSFFIAALVS